MGRFHARDQMSLDALSKKVADQVQCKRYFALCVQISRFRSPVIVLAWLVVTQSLLVAIK